MPVTNTTADYRSWTIDSNDHEPAEVLTYINAISAWNNAEVKSIMINFVDKVVAINGLPAFPSTDSLLSSFDSTVSPFEYNSENSRVKFIGYYSDRDIVEVMYDAHPLDPPPRNSRHSGAEFSALFESIFTWWKESAVAHLNYLITSPAFAEPTFD